MKCIIVDDEPHAIGLLKNLLNDYCPEVKILHEDTSIDQAYESIRLYEPDILFLDIKIGNSDGFELLDRFESLPFEVVFTTAYNHYAVKAFDYGAIHYLTKPIHPEKLESAVKRVQETGIEPFTQQFEKLKELMQQNQVDKISLPNRMGSEFVAIGDIVYCMASGSYTTIFMSNGEEKLISKPIGYLEKLLDKNIFCRTHKKYLVNTGKISSFVKGRTSICVLGEHGSVEVSKGYKDELLEMLKRRVIF